MKRLYNKAVLPVFALLLFVPLFISCSQHTQEGAGIGAAVGATAGALIDDDNPWRGAVIGGALGAAFGGTIAEVSNKAAHESVEEGRPVRYESEDGYRRVEASPEGYDEHTRCHKVRERVWEGDRLVKDEVREVCESEKTENVY